MGKEKKKKMMGGKEKMSLVKCEDDDMRKEDQVKARERR